MRVCQTIVVRPRCTGSQTARTVSPIGAAAKKLVLLSIVVVAWQWLVQAAAAKEGLSRVEVTASDRDFYEGKLAAAQYWIQTELPRVGALGALCR